MWPQSTQIIMGYSIQFDSMYTAPFTIGLSLGLLVHLSIPNTTFSLSKAIELTHLVFINLYCNIVLCCIAYRCRLYGNGQY